MAMPISIATASMAPGPWRVRLLSTQMSAHHHDTQSALGSMHPHRQRPSMTSRTCHILRESWKRMTGAIHRLGCMPLSRLAVQHHGQYQQYTVSLICVVHEAPGLGDAPRGRQDFGALLP